MQTVIEIRGLSKRYAPGFEAIRTSTVVLRGEIFACSVRTRRGKTTLISTICGIVNSDLGQRDGGRPRHRQGLSRCALADRARSTGAHDRRVRVVFNTVSFSRGLFGKPRSAHIEKVLRDLSLWDRKDSRIMTLSGGMKRRS
jgi:ABC-2 type transport system ATP-binding protein